MSEPILNADASAQNNPSPLTQVPISVSVQRTKPKLPTVRKAIGKPAKSDDAALAQVVERARQAYLQFGLSTWQFAWALAELKTMLQTMNPDKKITDQMIIDALTLGRTPARVGQLINTANAYPREGIDTSIPFRVYTDALGLRKNKNLTPAELLAFVIENPTSKAIAEHVRQQKPTKPRHERLVIYAEHVTKKGKDGVIKVIAKLNGVDHKLDDNLASVTKKYFRGLLDAAN